jgi:FtsP/CotA-like multicopper oxidase with cupredoxin domain
MLLSVLLIAQRASGAGVTYVRNADFAQPDECSSTSMCKLTLEAVKYVGPNTSFSTRGYNGNIPGPTMRVSPGTSLFVDFKNALEDTDNYALAEGSGGEAGDTNTAQLLNTTNLHTHGLHTSPNAPGDNVMATISPGESRFYDIEARPKRDSFKLQLEACP